MRRKKDDVIILPIGSTEQHGPHLPTCVDTVIANGFAYRIAEKINGVVAPALSYGYKSKPLSGGGPLFPVNYRFKWSYITSFSNGYNRRICS